MYKLFVYGCKDQFMEEECSQNMFRVTVKMSPCREKASLVEAGIFLNFVFYLFHRHFSFLLLLLLLQNVSVFNHYYTIYVIYALQVDFSVLTFEYSFKSVKNVYLLDALKFFQ